MPSSVKARFDELLKLMATVPPEALTGVSVGKQSEAYPASDAEPSAC